MLGRSSSLRYGRDIIQVFVIDGELVEENVFRNLEPNKIKSIAIVPDIELIKSKHYEMVLVYLKNKIKK